MITPHCCACKLKIIKALAKFRIQTFKSMIYEMVLLSYNFDIKVCEMVISNIVKPSTRIDYLLQMQLEAKKDKIFVVKEVCQQYRSFLRVSQDPLIRNMQKFATFLDKVQNHFNEFHLANFALRFARFLEAKWDIIKHDVAKFIRNYIVLLLSVNQGHNATMFLLYHQNYYANTLQLYRQQCVDMAMMCQQIINGHMAILN